MSAYTEKARELGNLILESEKAKALEDARVAFHADPEAQPRMDVYNAYLANVQTAIDSGAMTDEQYAMAQKRMAEMVVELKAYPVIGALVTAENEFNFFVNQIMTILKTTITGEEPGGCAGCSGHSHGGADCSGCHQ